MEGKEEGKEGRGGRREGRTDRPEGNVKWPSVDWLNGTSGTAVEPQRGPWEPEDRFERAAEPPSR